jgi:hypothetical protein
MDSNNKVENLLSTSAIGYMPKCFLAGFSATRP